MAHSHDYDSAAREPGGNGATNRLIPPIVLIVEDDAPVRNMLGITLPVYGYSCELAAGGAEAIEIYKKKHIDIVLLDVQMPHMDGPETLAALREINPDVLCCFMTGWPGDYAGPALYELEAAGVIQKPFTLTELCKVLEKILSKK